MQHFCLEDYSLLTRSPEEAPEYDPVDLLDVERLLDWVVRPN
jgi:hypothetical protein